LESIGYSQFMANDYDKALRSMEDCLAQYRKFGSEKLVTRGRVNVGQVLVALGDVERTEPLARETLEEGRAQGEPKFIHYPALSRRLRVVAWPAAEGDRILRREPAGGA
jgi:hypothetical protein